MGTIYKRGRLYWIQYYRQGKPYQESTKSTKEADAKRLLKKREGEIAEGKLPGIYFDKVFYDDLSSDLETDYELNGRKSLDRIKISLSHLEAEFKGFRIVNITTSKIAAYIDKRIAEGAAHATINRELSALKRMLTIGARSTPPKVNRVPFIPMLKENNTRKGFFEHGDFIALRDALPEHLKGLITFAYKVGWRHAEIAGLTWNRVDLENGIVRLDPGETKNDEGRTIYLDDELKEILQAYWEARKKSSKILPFVFLNEDSTDRVKRFDKAWRAACESAEIGFRLFHDFRRTAVRNMVRAGIPERVAMMISGHKTRSVFDRYNIVSDSDLKIAAAKQEAYLESQTTTKTVTIRNFEAKEAVQGVSKSLESLVPPA